MPLEHSTLAAALEGLRDWIVRSPRWLLIRRMPATSVSLTTAVVACLLLSAALPTTFTLAFGGLVGTLLDAMEDEAGAPARDRVMGWLVALGLIFVAQQMLVSLMMTAGQMLGRRVMGDHARQVMRATMRRHRSAPVQPPVVAAASRGDLPGLRALRASRIRQRHGRRRRAYL
jgi:hypothetical protein